MKSRTNAVIKVPNAAPMMTATARSTTLPRSRNFRKPLMWHLRPPSWPNGVLLSGRHDAGVEDSCRVDRTLRGRQRRRERCGALLGIPGLVVATHCVVMRDRAAGGEHRVARRRLHLVPLRELAAPARR